MKHQRCIAAVIDNQVGAKTAREGQCLTRTRPVVLQRLALPGEHWHARGRYRRRSGITRGKDVAGTPAHLRPKSNQRLNQHRRFRGHVQTPHDAHPLQRLRRPVLLAHRHQPRHLLLRKHYLLTTDFGQTRVCYPIILCLYNGHVSTPVILIVVLCCRLEMRGLIPAPVLYATLTRWPLAERSPSLARPPR